MCLTHSLNTARLAGVHHRLLKWLAFEDFNTPGWGRTREVHPMCRDCTERPRCIDGGEVDASILNFLIMLPLYAAWLVRVWRRVLCCFKQISFSDLINPWTLFPRYVTLSDVRLF